MTESLWEFSNRVYALDGVADACLRLQHRHGADVNLILCCCWAGVAVGTLPVPTVREAVSVSAEWTANVVGPLRQVRTWMKGATGESPLRDRVKRDELDAERLEQERLEALVSATTESSAATTQTGPEAVAANVKRWLVEAGITLEADGRADIDLIVRATVGDGADAAGGT